MTYLNRTHGAGWRAGMVPKPLITRSDGTKVLADGDCPFKLRRQFISRFLWWEGYYAGTLESFKRSARRWRAV